MSSITQQISQIDVLFREYFNEYYLNHKEIQSILFYTMENDSGYYAVLEYKNYRQYVNYFCNYFSIERAVVNSCFEFENRGQKFLCNFDDVLDLVDSDDLDFYTYSNCFEDESILTSVDCIMSVAEKYRLQLDKIALSNSLKEKYIKENFDDDEKPNSIIENEIDVTYSLYYKLFLKANESTDEYYKYLKEKLIKQYRKNQLDTLYEKRAYRVLNNLTKQNIKRLDKELKKTDKISKKDKFLMYLPVIILAVIFAVLFAVIGYRIDESIFSDCIGKKHYSSMAGFGFSGVCISLIVSVLLPDSVYKLFVKKSKYDSFIRMVNAQSIQGTVAYKAVVYLFAIVAALAMTLFFTAIFCFNGLAFKADSIVYKEYAFSEMREFSFEDTEIAIVEGSYSDSEYSAYVDTAYAFKLGDEWYEYGVPYETEIEQFIKNIIEKHNKNVKTYKSLKDIEP